MTRLPAMTERPPTRRPFRFAVQMTQVTSAAEWREFAHKAEDLGYSTLFLADHYLGPGPGGTGTLMEPQQLAPIAAMAAAAAWTSTLRIGCRVFCMDYHVPAALAKEAATLDLLSDGRLEFGIGAGTNRLEYERMGLDFAEPRDRVAKLEEVVRLVKAHWSGEVIACEGQFVKGGGYSGLPHPVQRPAPPIMIGGSRKRVLSLAAREADIVSMSHVPWTPINDAGLTPMEEAARRLAFVCDAAGSRLAALDIESSPYWSEVTDDAEEALARRAVQLRNADPDVLREHPNVLVGPVPLIVELLEERRETTGVNYVTVPGERLEGFGPVVADLAGR
jgi:probable F420-dependent oxidoreductase